MNGLIEIGYPQESEGEGGGEDYDGDEEVVDDIGEQSFFSFRKIQVGNNPTRFTIEFTNGHRLGQSPYNGLPFTWVAGDETWRDELKLSEPVFTENADSTISMVGMSGWDIFACGIIPEPDEDNADANANLPEIFWQIISFQHAVWGQTKIDIISGKDPRCVPISLIVEPALELQAAVAPAEEVVAEALDISIKEDTATLDPLDYFNDWHANLIDPATEGVGEDDPSLGNGLKSSESQYFAQTPGTEVVVKTIIEDDSVMEEDDFVYNQDQGGMDVSSAEQADQSAERLILPDGSESQGSLDFANRDRVHSVNLEDRPGTGIWPGLAPLSRYYSVGNLFGGPTENDPNIANLMGIRGTRSEDVMMNYNKNRISGS
ncbi:hypothetical protein ABW20_dc0106484 [Dactylellina cionopaga]|nr:hypothetical protein ABW20_dc0106484 [Dactylellina cionopaga]